MATTGSDRALRGGADPGGQGLGHACACCGGPSLEPHLAVAGTVGKEGLIPTTSAFGTALASIVRCSSCGHMQLERMPGDDELARLYEAAASEDYVEEETGQRATAREVLGRIERFKPPGTILDVGCWVGFLLAEAGERGWSGVGLEPSEWASAWARDRLGLDVRTTDLFGAELSHSTFDAIFLGDVIEHLPEPEAALERISTLLAPGGVVAMALPDAGSRLARAMRGRWWSVTPAHLQYFTRGSMVTLLARVGFQPLLVETQPKGFTVRYYLGRVEGYSPRLAATLVRAAESIGVADRLWAPDFGDRMLVIARAR